MVDGTDSSAPVTGQPAPAAASAPDRSPRRASGRLRIVSSLLFLVFAGLFLVVPYLPWTNPNAHRLPPQPPAVALAPEPEDTPTPLPSPTATAVAPTATPAPAFAFTPAASPPTPTAIPSPTPRPQPALPARLRIPAIEVDAPIVGVGLLWNGEMEAPYQADQVGWFKLGARPGAVGNALLDGHLDWISSVAVFYRLGKLELGDAVSVLDAAGKEWRFQVEWKELVPADSPPMARIVGPTEVPALTLITCGGRYDRATQDFSHRWVVRAVVAPVEP